MASIVLTGLAANDPTPGNFLEINFAAGAASGSGSLRTALLIGNATTAGSAAAATVYGPDTAVVAQTEQDIITLFGAGSELHRMWLKFTAVNKATSLYLLTVAESGGTAATKTITLATAPTGTVTWRVYVEDEFVEYTAVSGDTLASMTSGMAAAINAQTRWPVTAAQATVGGANDSILLTGKLKGPRGNFVSTQSRLIGTSFGTTTTITSKASLASGATADSNTNALAAILAQKFDYIISAAEDATQFGAVVTQVNSQALPLSGIRQRCFCGAVDGTLSNVNTIATGRNAALAEIVWEKSSDWTPAELAAWNAGVYALLENSGSKPRFNFSKFPTSQTDAAIWQNRQGPRDGTNPTAAEVRSALANGVTPMGRYQNGQSYIWKRITTRSLNGAVNDYRIRDAHKVCEMLFLADDVQAKLQLQFGGKDIVDDPKQGGPPVDGQTVSIALIKAAVQEVITAHGNDNRLDNPDAINAKLVVQRETSPASRVSIRIPCDPVEILDQIATALDQVG